LGTIEGRGPAGRQIGPLLTGCGTLPRLARPLADLLAGPVPLDLSPSPRAETSAAHLDALAGQFKRRTWCRRSALVSSSAPAYRRAPRPPCSAALRARIAAPPGLDASQPLDLACLQPATTAGAHRVEVKGGLDRGRSAPRPPPPGRPATPTHPLVHRRGVSVRYSLAFSRKSAARGDLVPRAWRQYAEHS
jgi:hypothetical protein